MVFLGACSALTGLPPASHLYLVQYNDAINAADSAVISKMGGTTVLAIPLAKAIVFRSSQTSDEVQAIPGKVSVVGVDSVNQVVGVAVTFTTAPSDADLASVMAFAASSHRWGPVETSPTIIEASFRLNSLNDLAAIRNISHIDLEYPGTVQTN